MPIRKRNLAVLTGSASNDQLVGSSDDDELKAYGGQDQLLGNQGDDVLRGGDGNVNGLMLRRKDSFTRK